MDEMKSVNNFYDEEEVGDWLIVEQDGQGQTLQTIILFVSVFASTVPVPTWAAYSEDGGICVE